MPFRVALPNTGGTIDLGTVIELSPKPTVVEYPDGAAATRLETTGGSLIQQQPLQDNRLRSWVWSGYPGWLPQYQSLWQTLLPLRSRYRLEGGADFPYVFLFEDETGLLVGVSPGASTVTETANWVRARVLEVSRTLRTQGSSLVVYEQTRLRFVIDDPTWNNLG